MVANIKVDKKKMHPKFETIIGPPNTKHQCEFSMPLAVISLAEWFCSVSKYDAQ